MTASVRGSVVAQVAGIELLARYSLNSLRHTSVLSSLEEFREQERGSVTDKEWNRKILRDQFMAKSLEILYRKYDDKLMLGYQSLFLILLIIISIAHILTIVFVVGINSPDPHNLIAVICYAVRAFIAIPIIALTFIEKLTNRFKWIKLISSVLMLIVLVVTDLLPVYIHETGPPLRPGFVTLTLLACYVFLPIKNNYTTLALGTLISLSQIAVLWTVTYKHDSSIYNKVGGDLLYLIGVNFLGIYYRLMNEIVKRRSFLDRRACVEITLRLNYEKEKEERLLLSILPEHIAHAVRKDIREIFMKIQSKSIAVPTKTFNHLYVEEHKNVSILYADIVNYTMITTTLPPKILVETLNELFGKFDEASIDHEVLRIKFLGDCYYCVSGVPQENVLHAKSCVDLGLEMISIIGEVRERKRLDIDMRIGVHSGSIMSGLIGLRKWQFDIWSKDATIANKMESTGKPGKVHITDRTLEELKENARNYIIEPHYDARSDPLLAKYRIDTFLVSRLQKHVGYRRASVGMEKMMRKQKKLSENASTGTSPLRRRTTGFMDNNLDAYRLMQKEADTQMATVIEAMPSGMISEYMKEETINPYTLLYRNASWERSFIKQPDPLFKYFIGAGLFVLILMMGIQGLTIEILEPSTIAIDGALLLLLIVLQPLTWTQYIWKKWYGSDKPKNIIIKFFYDQSASIIWSASARSILYVFVSTMMSTSALVSLSECHITYATDSSKPIFDENCMDPWHLAQACSLALMISFLFSRVFFLFKWAVGLTLTAIYLWIVWDVKSIVFSEGQTWNADLDPRISHTLMLAFLTLTLHWTDRQTEYRNRLDHRWKRQLTQEQEEAYTMKLVNNMLLQNILPSHVADIYLNTTRGPDDLYYEEYKCVSVMFASLTDYKLGIDDDNNVSERQMLTYLDQLISDFDKLLLSDEIRRLRVEKIKMAGWTYMAACGLEQGRRNSACSEGSSQAGPYMRSNQTAYENDVVLTMIEFAATMMKQLKKFNVESFQGTNLRVGISHGEVTAGVVGSLKPLYDIWGNAVNMASRMDSTGEAGRIQVTENTAIVLDRQGILVQYRGKTYVKGAGYVRTYFVPLDNDFDVIYKTSEPVIIEMQLIENNTKL